MNKTNSPASMRVLLICAALGAIVIAYWPGVHGPFMFDDIPNIVENKALHLTSLSIDNLLDASFSIRSGATYRPLALASLALNYYVGELNPVIYKMTNIGIHCINFLLVYWLFSKITECLRVTGRDEHSILPNHYVVVLAAAIWALHPLQLTSVLYVVQRMASMSASFVLLGLISYLHGRLLMIEGRRGLLYLIMPFAVFLPLGLLAKESAILMVFFIVVSEFFLLNFNAEHTRDQLFVKYAFAAFFATTGLLTIYLVFHVDWILSGYRFRAFDLTERLLTESRVLFFYLRMILLPDVSAFGLYHDDIPISTGLLNPVSTLVSLLAWFAAITGCVWLRNREPILCWGIAFFLAGHALESTIIALELVHEHRNYMPSVGVIYVVAFYTNRLLQGRAAQVQVALVCVSLLFSGVLFVRAQSWQSWSVITLTNVNRHPLSPRANYEAGVWYFSDLLKGGAKPPEESKQLAEQHFRKSLELDQQSIGGITGIYQLYDLLQLPLHDAGLRSLLLERLRNAALGDGELRKFVEFLTCNRKYYCSVPAEQLAEMISAIEHNSFARKPAKSRVLNEYAVYLYEHQKLEKSLYYLNQAIELYPEEDEYWLSAIQVAAITKDKALRERLIDEYISSSDESEVRSRRLSRLQRTGSPD